MVDSGSQHIKNTLMSASPKPSEIFGATLVHGNNNNAWSGQGQNIKHVTNTTYKRVVCYFL